MKNMEDESELRENAALCIILAVTVFEAFLNVYFRVLVSEPAYATHQQRVLTDLKKKRSIEHKLNTWPKEIFGKSLDLTQPATKAFLALKSHRNELIHFESSHQTFEVPGVELRGLADILSFAMLTLADATKAIDVAEAMMCEIFRLRGVPENELSHALHLWTGKVPM